MQINYITDKLFYAFAEHFIWVKVCLKHNTMRLLEYIDWYDSILLILHLIVASFENGNGHTDSGLNIKPSIFCAYSQEGIIRQLRQPAEMIEITALAVPLSSSASHCCGLGQGVLERPGGERVCLTWRRMGRVPGHYRNWFPSFWSYNQSMVLSLWNQSRNPWLGRLKFLYRFPRRFGLLKPLEIEITSWKCCRDVCLERDLHGLEM